MPELIWAGIPPGIAGWLGGGGVFLLLMALFLRPRPPRVVVASHVLWELVLPRRRNPWLWDLLLLLLQLLALAALVLALRDPSERSDDKAPVADGGAARERIFILDSSRSMAALEPDGRTRLEHAVAELGVTLDSLPDGVRFVLIAAGRSPSLLCPLGIDRSRAKLALRRIRPGHHGADLAAARRFALDRPGLDPRHAAIEVWTDDPEAAATLAVLAMAGESPPVLIRAPFTPRRNVSISAFDVRAARGIPAEEEALVILTNHAEQPARVGLQLETRDAVLGRAEVEVPAEGSLHRSYRFSSLQTLWLEARIDGVRWGDEASGPDPLPGDDLAFALAEPVHPARIGLAGAANRFLSQGLSLLPGVELVPLDPAAWDPALAESLDVVFLDGVLPPGPLPSRVVIIRPPEGGELGVGPVRIDPKLTDWNHDHPLFRGLVLGDLLIRKARLLRTQPGDARLLGTADGPIAIARVGPQGERQVLWGFDFADSDLPLRIAFPQVLLQTVLWMREARAPTTEPPHPWPSKADLRLGPGSVVVRDATRTPPGGGGTTAPLLATEAGAPGLRWSAPAPSLLSLDDGATLLPIALADDGERDLRFLPSTDPAKVALPPSGESASAPRRFLVLLLVGGLLLATLEFLLWTR